MDFIKRQDIPRPVSQTMGRYSLEGVEDLVYDNLLKREVKPDKDNCYEIAPLGKIHYHELFFIFIALF